jgi:hypothetical protein
MKTNDGLPRRGVATFWVLVVLAVLTAVLGTITCQFLAGRSLVERRQNQLQARWLARAGVELAAARLLADPGGYKGETVEVVPGGKVRIEVRAESGSPDTFVVRSEGRFPAVERGVTRSEERRFRRTVEKDRVRLEVVPPDAGRAADAGRVGKSVVGAFPGR